MEEEQLQRWKEIINQTEDLVDQWKDEKQKSPYLDQICKSWENFIDKQKDELQYQMKRAGSCIDQNNLE